MTIQTCPFSILRIETHRFGHIASDSVIYSDIARVISLLIIIIMIISVSG